MAISLLPKKRQKKQFKLSRELIKENKSVVFACTVLFLVLAVYSGAYFYTSSLNGRIENVLEEVKSIQGQRNTETEEAVLDLDGKLSTVSSLLDNHIYSSKLLKFIESITHPKVYFINFTFRAAEGTVILNGSTENYVSFGEQYIAFQQNEKISSLRLSDIKLSKAGKVQFGLSFNVDKSVFK